MTVGFAYRWAARKSPPPVAFAVGVAFLTSPALRNASGVQLFDVPFVALMMIALWALERRPEAERWIEWVGVGAVVLA